MSDSSLEEEILQIYREPIIGANYNNTYGEENLRHLVSKYRALNEEDRRRMLSLIVDYSKSPDLTSSYVSVGVLHALGKNHEVKAAYDWAQQQEEAHMYISHFDIGKSLADHFAAD